MMLSTELFVLSEMVGSASSLFLVSWSAQVIGIDVKRDTTWKDTIISWGGGGVMLQSGGSATTHHQSINCPTYQVSKHLASIQSPLQNNKYAVTNSCDFVEKVSK